MVDPRILEKSLDACPAIARSCVIGNNFLRGSAQFLCALVELRPNAPSGNPSTNMEIARAIRGINRALAPPLRISWSRVLILKEGEQIPINKKGQLWRKKLEALFGNRVAVLSTPSKPDPVEQPSVPSQSSQTNRDAVREIVLAVFADLLHLSPESLEGNADSTFAEVRIRLRPVAKY
jgi:hypothetical protein